MKKQRKIDHRAKTSKPLPVHEDISEILENNPEDVTQKEIIQSALNEAHRIAGEFIILNDLYNEHCLIDISPSFTAESKGKSRQIFFGSPLDSTDDVVFYWVGKLVGKAAQYRNTNGKRLVFGSFHNVVGDIVADEAWYSPLDVSYASSGIKRFVKSRVVRQQLQCFGTSTICHIVNDDETWEVISDVAWEIFKKKIVTGQEMKLLIAKACKAKRFTGDEINDLIMTMKYHSRDGQRDSM